MDKIFLRSQLKMTKNDDIRKLAIGQADDYTNGCFLDYNHFKNYYKMIAIDLSQQQALDADLKAIQQFNFTGNLSQGRNADGEIMNVNTAIFFIIGEAKETILDFPQSTVKVL